MNNMTTEKEKNKFGVMLPIETPPLKYSLFVADKLSIIMQHRDATNWLLNNFIQLVFYTDNLNTIDFKTHFLTIWPADTFKIDQHGTNLFLRETTINDSILYLDENNLLEHIIKWIDKGLYIYANVDVSKLRNTKYYSDIPLCHSSLVYGYDEQYVYQLDFNQNEDFGTLAIPHEDYINALLSKDLEKIFNEEKGMNAKYNLTLIKVKEDYGSFCKLDKDVIKYWVKSYIDCEKTSLGSNPFFNSYPIECGLNIYECVKKMVLKLTKEELLDYRIFHVLYEHKKIMLMRIEKLITNDMLYDDGSLQNACKDMIELTHEMRHLCLKYRITHSENIINKILYKLDALKQIDTCFMINLYKAL